MTASERSTELGNLPNSWEVLPCEEVCEKISVGIVVRPSSYYVPNGVPAFRSQNVRQDRLQLQPMVHISREANDGPVSKSKLSAGDVLMVRTGYPGTSCVVPPEFDGANCIDLIIIRPKAEKIRSEFLSRFFGSEVAMLQVQSGKGGLAQQHFNVGAVKRMLIAVPPLPEQKKIAHILSTVQRAIEEQERIIQTTTELKKALMYKLFTEGLRNEAQKQTEIGLVPESWEVVPLGALAKVGNGSTPKRDNQAYWQGGTIPWLNSARIHDRFITEPDQFVTGLAVKQCHLPRVKPNSLLIAITGQGKTLGNSAITRFETCINQHLAYAQFTSEKIVPDFVLWFMQTRYDFLRSIAAAGGSTKGALTCGYLKTLLIPVPSRAEQGEVVTTFHALEDKQAFAVRKQAALQSLFRTLLHQLMTAHIRVDD